MEQLDHIKQLYRKYLDDSISEHEKQTLFDFFESGREEELLEVVKDVISDENYPKDLSHLDARVAHLFQKIQSKTKGHDKISTSDSKKGFRWLSVPNIAAAAVILIALGFGAYFYFVDHTNLKSTIANLKSNDIDPGGNRAILTLADGRKIVLDEAANGELAEESGIKITKTEDGQLVYEILRHAPQARASDKRQPEAGSAGGGDRESTGVKYYAPTYNTIQTPRGGQYKIILPDSSVVWLNAASSLRYPTRFAGAERRVELVGEAYFSVRQLVRPLADQTQDIRHETANAQASSPSNGARSLSDYWRMSRVPFIVATATQEVQVLGTQFNINAYTDEAVVKTTLVEGSVAVRVARNQLINQSTNKLTNPPVVGHGQSTTLRPGQQSTLLGNSLAVAAVDVEEAIAWKEGLILLNNADLPAIIRQIERWYDVQFVLATDLPTGKTLSGEVLRDVKLSEVLRSLEINTGLKFTIEGRRVMVRR